MSEQKYIRNFTQGNPSFYSFHLGVSKKCKYKAKGYRCQDGKNFVGKMTNVSWRNWSERSELMQQELQTTFYKATKVYRMHIFLYVYVHSTKVILDIICSLIQNSTDWQLQNNAVIEHQTEIEIKS